MDGVSKVDFVRVEERVNTMAGDVKEIKEQLPPMAKLLDRHDQWIRSRQSLENKVMVAVVGLVVLGMATAAIWLIVQINSPRASAHTSTPAATQAVP